MSDMKDKLISIDIFDINNLGCGVGKYDGVVVFVRGAVTGDRVECKIIKQNKSYLVGKLIKILSPSPKRLCEGICSAPESCGGCVYRHINYDYELELKRNTVREAFRRAGLADVEVEQVRSTGVVEGYRNKVQFPVGTNKEGRLCAGIYASKSHRLAGGTDCRLAPPLLGEIADAVCELCDGEGIGAYDESTGKGVLRHIYIRRAAVTGQISVCLVINADRLRGGEKIAAELRRRYPDIVGVLININRKNTNVILGEHFEVLSGVEEIEDVLCGKRFRIAPDSFYQVNHDAAELLYSLAAERAGEGEDLCDLFCGAGTIGLCLAEKFSRLIGIEIVPSAIECARVNAELNGVENAHFVCGDAGDAEGILAAAERELGEIRTDVVVLDPPRKGCAPELVKYIADKGFRRVVYVSCDPVTLARDCAIFAGLGYSVGTVTPVDMFPRTGHVESVVLLRREKVGRCVPAEPPLK